MPASRSPLAAIRRLLNDENYGVVKQGLALAGACADPALWRSMAGRATTLDELVLTLKKGGKAPHRWSVALAVGRRAGLTGLRRLNLSSCNLQSLEPLRPLANLRQLDLTGCKQVTDLTPLAALPGLTEIQA